MGNNPGVVLERKGRVLKTLKMKSGRINDIYPTLYFPQCLYQFGQIVLHIPLQVTMINQFLVKLLSYWFPQKINKTFKEKENKVQAFVSF